MNLTIGSKNTAPAKVKLKLPKFIIFFFATTSVSLINISACSPTAYPLPVFQNAPEVMNLEILLAEYQSDSAAAAENYQGNTYLFPSVKANSVVSDYLDPRAVFDSELYLISGDVKFKPKYTTGLDHVAPGFIVDIVGEVQGWAGGYFRINKCFFIIVKGGDLPPPAGY